MNCVIPSTVPFVLCYVNNSNIEKEKVCRILEHLPISSTKVVNTKLIPYDETLMEWTGTEIRLEKKMEMQIV